MHMLQLSTYIHQNQFYNPYVAQEEIFNFMMPVQNKIPHIYIYIYIYIYNVYIHVTHLRQDVGCIVVAEKP